MPNTIKSHYGNVTGESESAIFNNAEHQYESAGDEKQFVQNFFLGNARGTDAATNMESIIARVVNSCLDKRLHSIEHTDGYTTELEDVKKELKDTKEELITVKKEFSDYRDKAGDGDNWKSINHIDWLQEEFDWENPKCHTVIGNTLRRISSEIIKDTNDYSFTPRKAMNSSLNSYSVRAIAMLRKLLDANPEWLAEYRRVHA